MKCILLSAGTGSRLGNLTKETPKCLLKVNNQTMLEHWWTIFKRYSVTDVLINTHYLPEAVVREASKLVTSGIRLHFVYEKTLLGTGKTIFANKDFVKDDKYFLVAYADTWMNVNLHTMIKVHKRNNSICTIGVYKPEKLLDQGVVEVVGKKITSIEEKPKHPKSSYAFAGIMLATRTVFKFYDESMTDLIKDWLPCIATGIYPFYLDNLVYDIGTPERYKAACDGVRKLGLQAL